jgi:D-3-phosphoglycerate dehydrogenase
MTWRVLISTPYFLPVVEEFRSRLEAEGLEPFTMEVRERLSEDELLPVVGTIDGAICGDDQFTGRVLRAAPRLKVISKWGTGIDSIDTSAAAKLGIRVCCTPNAFTDCVADTTLGYILCFARQLPWMDRDIRRDLWNKPDLISLRECTLGVIGVGNIGKAVVRRARAFGMTVLGTDPAPVPDSFVDETELSIVPLQALLEEADFVTLHCDLNPTSFHLIGRHELAAMRSSAYLINASRGPVVNEPALVDALHERRIAGAALDVFEVEPLPANSPLRAIDHCLLAPHNANSGSAARRRVHESTIANLLRGLREVKRSRRGANSDQNGDVERNCT